LFILHAGKIWLDNVQCNGGEKSIDLCKSRGWGNSDCTHDEDAGVICKDERLPGFVDSNVIDVRRYNGLQLHYATAGLGVNPSQFRKFTGDPISNSILSFE
jgi:hypothetical protein